ncbi:MAG: hypothetical protein HQL66_03295 [Magnetococcales bacterium]|nr:hypothetical protein [Magnetococcales bacterium]
MYCKYIYDASATPADLMADIVGLLTGTITATSGLSSSADKTNSQIITTVAAGWTVHDASAATNKKVLKAALADSGYKYLGIDLNTTGKLILGVYETWDATGHSAGNTSWQSDDGSVYQPVNLANGGTIYIHATARGAVFVGVTGGLKGLQGTYNPGSSTSAAGLSGITERTRGLAYDTTAAGYPPFVAFLPGIGGGFATHPRAKTYNGGDVTSFSFAPKDICSIGLQNLSGLPSGVDKRIPDGSGGGVVPAYPLLVSGRNSANNIVPVHMPAPYGDISALTGIYAIPLLSAGDFDENPEPSVVIDGTTHTNVTYSCWPAAAGNQLAVPKL